MKEFDYAPKASRANERENVGQKPLREHGSQQEAGSCQGKCPPAPRRKVIFRLDDNRVEGSDDDEGRYAYDNSLKVHFFSPILFRIFSAIFLHLLKGMSRPNNARKDRR